MKTNKTIMKHIKLFEQFINEKFSKSDIKKLKQFAEEVAEEIYDAYEKKFDSKKSDLDEDDYTADEMFDYIIDWAGDSMTADEVISEFNWEDLEQELGLE
jgi:glutamyl-tRNA reductase